MAAVVYISVAETVAPRGCFPGAASPSAMRRAGAFYRTASGAPVPNLGELGVQFHTNEGGQLTSRCVVQLVFGLLAPLSVGRVAPTRIPV